MPADMPHWFAADRVFQAPDGWYIGDPAGYRVGPYQRRAMAEVRSQQISAHLSRCDATLQRVRMVRRFLHAETRDSRRRVLTSATPGRALDLETRQQSVTRSGEQHPVRFRTNRFFNAGGRWYFTTREGIDVGPYDTRAAAERDAGRLIQLLLRTDTQAQARLTIQQFQIRPVIHNARSE